jgi:hypothetical protein
MVESDLDTLLRKLNRKDLVDWVPEMRIGKPAYDSLLATAREKRLGENHTANVLHALFRLRQHGSTAEVAQLFLDCLGDERIKVRSEAAKLLVGLLKLREIEPPERYYASLRTAKAGGLLHDVDSLVDAFLSSAVSS